MDMYRNFFHNRNESTSPLEPAEWRRRREHVVAVDVHCVRHTHHYVSPRIPKTSTHAPRLSTRVYVPVPVLRELTTRCARSMLRSMEECMVSGVIFPARYAQGTIQRTDEIILTKDWGEYV
jgi:hypothetical protein